MSIESKSNALGSNAPGSNAPGSNESELIESLRAWYEVG
jgi:hypothetical protein